MFDEIIKKWGGHEVSAMQVYTDLFGLGEGLIQRQDEEPGEFKSNPCRNPLTKLRAHLHATKGCM